jgi:sortase A
MARIARAAAALILISAGGFLVYRGLSTYFEANASQSEAAAHWRAPKPNRRSTASLTRPKAVIPEGQTFSHLEVPRLNESLYVVEGDNDSALEKGPGHVRGSAMPGENGNCVIAGHRDLHFRFLKNIEPGDKVYLETEQGRFCYRVTGTKVISPNQIQVLQPTRDAELHLITCYPFYFVGHAPKRFVVTAELEGEPSAAPAAQEIKVASPLKPAAPQPLAARPRVLHRPSIKRVPDSQSLYERSLQATRALNRAAASDLQTSLVY